MITNSVVPIPKAPMARARSARGMREVPFRVRGGGVGVAVGGAQDLALAACLRPH